ncbi:MAG: hypothetical protein UX89_C0009G0014 [Parcubacteria group bacterium GW2011_GWA2_47_16]|nr:MAG: hypothetical protein UX89_C0009G0014 [Parcubacteria group bacterium GW2011_GWA2_47_16]
MPHGTDDHDDGGEALGLEARLTSRFLKVPSEIRKVCSLGLPQAEVDGPPGDADHE